MKLTEMTKFNSTKLNNKMKEMVGWNIDLNALTLKSARNMMESVDGKLATIRKSSKIHESERNPAYTSMLLTRQVLESYILENSNALMEAKKDKKVAEDDKPVKGEKKNDKKAGKDDKAKKGGMSEKQAKFFGKKKGKKNTTESLIYRRFRLNEDELSQAQAMLAAKDMVDSMQDMIEDLSKMLNEQLPPLADSIRAAIGSAEADTFKGAATSTLQTLLSTVQTSRESMDQAVRALTGEAPDAMGADAGMGDMGDAGDMGLPDAGMDDFGASDAAAGGELPMGREKRF